MKTFFSIIFASIQPTVNEQVSIALLLINEKSIFFRYSKDKINILKKLISIESINFIKSYLKGIEEGCNKFNQKFYPENLIDDNPNKFTFFTENYLNYLHIYNNNLITFSKPTPINITLNQENFDRLFKKFISNELTLKDDEKSIDKIQGIKDILYPKIEKRVNTDIDIKLIPIPEISIPRSFLPEKINFIGKNEKQVTGQIVNFNKKENYLENVLKSYYYYITEINSKGVSFIIGTEPNKTSIKQRYLWEEIKNNKLINYVSCNEIDLIKTYLDEHDVQPLL
jgi:hypothetical protein